MPDIVPHCTLQASLWEHLKLQEEGTANRSLTSFPSLQRLSPETQTGPETSLINGEESLLAQVWLLFSDFAYSSTKSPSLGLEHPWEISSGNTKEEIVPALKCPQPNELETQEAAQHLGG